MLRPSLLVGETDKHMVAQCVQEYQGQALLSHVRERLRVDPEVGLPGAQHFEEVDAVLRCAALEPCEVLVADMGHVSVVALMPGAGVVDR